MDRRTLLSRLAAACLAAFAVSVSLAVPGVAQERVTVFAAASLKNALDNIAAAYKAETGNEVVASYAASSALARQIEQAAPADIFISADLDWMAYLSEKDLIDPAHETHLLGNRIVIVAAANSDMALDIVPGFDLAAALGAEGRLAMANVEAVPAGKYGKQALETLGAWSSVSDRTAQAENVRAALALVATGEAPLGIVYQTDATAEPGVRIVATFPEDSHAPIVYPATVLKTATAAEAAQDFLDYLQSEKARPLFEAQGFTVLTPQASD